MGNEAELKSSRKSVTLPDELWDALIDVQHAKKLPTQTGALEMVVRAGLRLMLEQMDARDRRKHRHLI
jgi:hypothetical protein